MGNSVCVCGVVHAECATRASVGENKLPLLREWLIGDGLRRVLVVADVNTVFAAREMITMLSKDIDSHLFVFNEQHLVPDETAVGRLLIAAGGSKPFEAMLAVGSGTLNDLTRYVSHQLGIPYYVAATAASMDGYASSVAPLTVDGLKRTFPAAAPKGVLGDAAVLSSAPEAMTAAGYGDMAGKFTSVNDWELEHIVTGGGFCPVLAGEIRKAAEDCMAVAPGEDAVRARRLPDGAPPARAVCVMDALVRSGLVMQRTGDSRPASGSEHHLSHFWEMRMLLRGQTPALHGAKVGVSTLAALRVNGWLLQEQPDFARAYTLAQDFDPEVWRNELTAVYGRAAEGVLSLWPDEDAATRRQSLDALRREWENILTVIRRNIPSPETVEAGLKQMSGPVTPQAMGLTRKDVTDGVLHAWKLRRRFTVWRIADLMGLLPEYAERLVDTFTWTPDI